MEIQQSWRKFIWLRKSYLIWHKTSKAPKSSYHRVHTHTYIHSGETLFTIKKVYTRFQTFHMIDVDKEFRLWYYVIWNLKLHAWMKLMKKIFFTYLNFFLASGIVLWLRSLFEMTIDIILSCGLEDGQK